MQTLSAIFLKDEMPEIREMVKVMKQCEVLSEQDIPSAGSELVRVTMLLTDPSDLYSIGLLVGIDRSRKLSAIILKKLLP